jgi:sarcosine oxidase
MTSKSYDVIVAGLGAMGAAALYQLSARGVRVLGIDRYRPPHSFGSSHGESRITRQAIGEGGEYVGFVLRSNEIWRQLQAETGKKLFLKTGIAVIGPRAGGPPLRSKPDFVGSTARVAVHHSIDHEVLSGAELSYRYPQFMTTGDEIAYFEPGAGVLFPEACIEAQLGRAREFGADIRLGETILGWAATETGVSLKTADGDYASRGLVLATGPWIPALAGTELSKVLRVYPQLMHWFPVEEPYDYSPSHFPVYIWIHGTGADDHFYGFPALGDHAAIKVATEQYSIEWNGGALNPDASFARAWRDIYENHARGRLGGIGGKAIRSAPCLYSVTPDGDFILDLHPASDRVWIVSACSGHGFKHSAGVGEALAQWVTEGKPALDVTPFRLGRFNIAA